MRTHMEIDARSLALAQAIVNRIDQDPDRRGLETARQVCARWLRKSPLPVIREWQRILSLDWPEIRDILVGESEESARLRQSSPFCDILTPRERWDIYGRF